jgi:hypothetical protein
LRMLLRVPGATVSLGLPDTVTRPGLVGCLNWRWLPAARHAIPTGFVQLFQNLANFHPPKDSKLFNRREDTRNESRYPIFEKHLDAKDISGFVRILPAFPQPCH